MPVPPIVSLLAIDRPFKSSDALLPKTPTDTSLLPNAPLLPTLSVPALIDVAPV
jgi:hypothetical protein